MRTGIKSRDKCTCLVERFVFFCYGLQKDVAVLKIERDDT